MDHFERKKPQTCGFLLGVVYLSYVQGLLSNKMIKVLFCVFYWNSSKHKHNPKLIQISSYGKKWSGIFSLFSHQNNEPWKQILLETVLSHLFLLFHPQLVGWFEKSSQSYKFTKVAVRGENTNVRAFLATERVW